MTWNSYDYSKVRGIPEFVIRTDLFREKIKNRKGSVLEVGIGAGDVTIMLLSIFPKITCVDLNKDNYNDLKNRAPKEHIDRIEFIHSKIEDVDFRDKKFDNIVLYGVLEHFEHPVDILKNLSLRLSADGKIYILVPLANSLHRLLGVKMGMISKVTEVGDSDIKLGHYRVYTPELIKEHLNKAGLEISYKQPFYMKPLTTSILSSLPIEVHKGLDLLGREYPEFASYIYIGAVRKEAK